jgi:allophanate hydrolase
MTLWISRRPDEEVAAELAKGRGPLAGLRLAVKDNVDAAGLPTTAGCLEFAYLPERDAAAVAALRAAGAVVVGKTNLDQFATGEADIAIGTDTAGSGRIPTGLQGIVGIKPTIGVVSTDGVVPACESYDCVTVFARHLELANRAMGVMACGARDRAWPSDVRVAAPPNPVIAVPNELPGLDNQWRAAFETAVTALANAGARVVTVDLEPFLAAAKLLYDDALVTERYAAVGEFIDAHADAVLDPTVRRIISAARDIPARRLVHDRREVNRLRAVAMAALDGVDALVVAADPVGVNLRMGTYTNFCNLFDMCAVSVPAGMAGPAQFGIAVLAHAFEDAVALDIAALTSGVQAPVEVWPLAAADVAELVVFGAHLRGGPLAHQMTDLGARWAGEVTTAPHYQMSVLPVTPAKPAVTRVPDGQSGTALLGHRWLLSPAALGRFLAALPAPMQLGKVEFDDGTWRTAFGCDAAAASGTDISAYGSWPAAVAAGAV